MYESPILQAMFIPTGKINLDEKMVFLSIEFIHSFQKSTVITYSILPSVTFYPLLAESLVG